LTVIQAKSEQNFTAIDILQNEGLFTSGVHCAYYSSLQLLIHYCYEYCGFSEEEAIIEMDKSQKGSHVFYLSKYVNEIKKIDKRKATEFYDFFTRFKRKRTLADYKNIEIFESDLVKAKEAAIKIKMFLNNINENGDSTSIRYI